MGKTAQYVLGLIDTLLGAGEREKCFDWARGDPSPKTKRTKKLPFDSVWEARKLIIEIDEDQHGEATPFFDKPQKLTVSRVHRGEQRALYDARKRAAAMENGYVVLAIMWSRKKKRRPVEDLAELRKLICEAGVSLSLDGTGSGPTSENGPWDPYVTLCSPEILDPPHAPLDRERRRAIDASMKKHGWRGRPLLAARHGLPEAEATLTCLTGSHRIAAARKAGIKAVPVLVVDCRDDLESAPILHDPLADILRYVGDEALAVAIRALWDAEDAYQ
jgi:hypothetical protein